MKVLVVGGAGYIGSHMVKWLGERGHQVTTLDNLSTGYADAVLQGDLVVGDIADTALLDRLLSQGGFDAVMHFAAFSLVGESVRDPGKYYRNNVANTVNLLEAMVRHGVGRFVFSSSAAIFGEPKAERIAEDHPRSPINPYGRSKWMVEQLLEDYERAHGLKAVCLRYFNAAGADPEGALGERHDPETHLIPLALQAAAGRREALTIFGTDYDTPDGSCIRDYIHVQDLCAAHYLALDWLAGNDRSGRFNLGNGNGYSVLEVVAAVERVTGRTVPVAIGTRRLGDPARLVADASLARSQLDWRPQRQGLDEIVADAWRWYQRYWT